MREQLVLKPPRLASQPPALPRPLPANHCARKEADLVEGDLNPKDKIALFSKNFSKHLKNRCYQIISMLKVMAMQKVVPVPMLIILNEYSFQHNI